MQTEAKIQEDIKYHKIKRLEYRATFLEQEITKRWCRVVIKNILLLGTVFLVFSLSTSVVYSQPKTGIEGYNGIPWGTELQKFKKLKKYKGYIRAASSDFFEVSETGSKFIKEFLAHILGVPTYIDYAGDEALNFEYVPSKFITVYIRNEDAYYIFYKGKLAMTFSKLKGDSYEEYHDSLSSKYEKITTVSKHFPPSKAMIQAMGFSTTCGLYATIFKKGATDVYLIKEKIYSSGTNFGSISIPPSEKTYLSILYISDSYFNLIKKDIEINSTKAQTEKDRAKQETKEKARESDLRKIK